MRQFSFAVSAAFTLKTTFGIVVDATSSNYFVVVGFRLRRVIAVSSVVTRPTTKCYRTGITTTSCDSIEVTTTSYNSVSVTTTNYDSDEVITTSYDSVQVTTTSYDSVDVTTTRYDSTAFTTSGQCYSNYRTEL